MKSTGVCRQVDELGRIVLPISIRKNLNIQVKDHVEIFMEGDRVILRKKQVSCVFCENAEELVPFNDKMICPACLRSLKKLA